MRRSATRLQVEALDERALPDASTATPFVSVDQFRDALGPAAQATGVTLTINQVTADDGVSLVEVVSVQTAGGITQIPLQQAYASATEFISSAPPLAPGPTPDVSGITLDRNQLLDQYRALIAKMGAQQFLITLISTQIKTQQDEILSIKGALIVATEGEKPGLQAKLDAANAKLAELQGDLANAVNAYMTLFQQADALYRIIALLTPDGDPNSPSNGGLPYPRPPSVPPSAWPADYV
jgi:hypothetical protein